jgi:hypothetical protein
MKNEYTHLKTIKKVIEQHEYDYKSLYILMINDVVNKVDFRSMSEYMRILELKWNNVTPPQRLIKSTCYHLLIDSATKLINNKLDKIFCNHEHLNVEIYSINYHDKNLAGNINVYFNLERKENLLRDYFSLVDFENAYLSTDEKIEILNNRLSAVEDKLELERIRKKIDSHPDTSE